ncbi:MAG TPA: septum formation initiator family protein [Atribacteraceae bacterium]|nr:septum formation initiator family protein [Atribacteraceae bacterium]
MQPYIGDERSLKSRGIRFFWKKVLIAAFFAVFLFAWSIGFTERLVDYHRVTRSLEEIQKREWELKEEIARLRQEQENLEEDWYIEMQARDRLNLVKPGEVIIRMVDPE